jgi:hypothetical protein
MRSKIPFGRAALAASVAVPCVLAAAGCTVGPDFTSPDAHAPVGWFASRPVPKPVHSEPVAEPVDPNWWNLFNDPQLTGLEDRVAAQNLDVRIATIRIAESRAQRGVVASAQFPTLGANGSYQRERASNNGVFSLVGPEAAGSEASGAGGFGAGAITSTNQAPFDLYQYGLDASWEIDLWGRVRRSVESADASITASKETQRDTLLSSLAEQQAEGIDVAGFVALDRRDFGGGVVDLGGGIGHVQVGGQAADGTLLGQLKAVLRGFQIVFGDLLA